MEDQGPLRSVHDLVSLFLVPGLAACAKSQMEDLAVTAFGGHAQAF